MHFCTENREYGFIKGNQQSWNVYCFIMSPSPFCNKAYTGAQVQERDLKSQKLVYYARH